MRLAEGGWLSSTIRSFSTVVHRRGRSGPDKTETLLTFAHLLANQSANYRRQGCRPEGGPHRRVTTGRTQKDQYCKFTMLLASKLRMPKGPLRQRVTGWSVRPRLQRI